ncbi:large conductance mechanosensitive channel protein MscL [Virgibacillus doumboii]|uniref:large conductance mechanosensitive channel protein MscL n=1 Tax=Virgibacillus doumboii TaxID=2697503 RepID=UPI0013DF739C|nr:large conductance mechanosensitive channel protein MscL [Virgibacillus doumboii]
MWSDFKAFALKGNVVDLAVAVIIGTAFGKIVTSLVENIMMPLIGILIDGIDFTNLTYTVRNADVLYGEFIQSVFDFLVIAFSIFFFVRLMAKFRRAKEPDKQPKPDEKEELLREIRDLLKREEKGSGHKVKVHIGRKK